MARGLNKVQIIGNLGADPEMRYTPAGAGVTNFRVAVSRNRRGNDGNMVDETEWFRCVAFDSNGYKLAEICNEYLRKGQKVYVEGRLQSRKYTDKDGIERTSVEIVASEMIMLSGRGEEGGHGEGVASGAPAQTRAGGPQRATASVGSSRTVSQSEDDYADDVPF